MNDDLIPPPLPQPTRMLFNGVGNVVFAYGTDQLRERDEWWQARLREAVEAEREANAVLCGDAQRAAHEGEGRMTTPNPFFGPATELLRLLDPSAVVSRKDVTFAAQQLTWPLGTHCNVSTLDNGTIALVLLCALLREHGGTIKALSDAHNQLHQS